MKLNKLFAGVLAAAMMMSVGVSAMAATVSQPDQSGNYTDMSTVTLKKTYAATNTGTTSPAETFGFSDIELVKIENGGTGASSQAAVPTIANVTYSAGEAGSSTATKDITITLPSYSAVGVYHYEFTEVAGVTAGVDYRSDVIKLVVTVIEQNGQKRVAAVHTESTGSKSDVFTNTYSAGSLTVGKTVAGFFGDQNTKFNMTVTFKAPDNQTVKSDITVGTGETKQTVVAAGEGWTGEKTYSFALAHGETITFDNIPYGVTYTVAEDDYTADGYLPAGYDDNKTGTINAASVSTTITNTKNGTVDTGVILDNAPYILMLAVVAGGVFFMVAKKRREE